MNINILSFLIGWVAGVISVFAALSFSIFKQFMEANKQNRADSAKKGG